MAFSQNIGINTSTPSESLDVYGNINLTGSIKANGADGSPGQLLGKNSAGNLAWLSVGDLKNFQVITKTTTTSWTVPAGVTKLIIEAWGAGGGGSKAGGGAAGNYFIASATVVPGDVITIKCGLAGARGEAFNNGIAGSGSPTTVNVPPNVGNITANGGGGATNLSAGYAGAVWPQTINYNTPVIHYAGENGSMSSEQYFQYQAGVFVTAIQYGNGGNSPFVPPTGDKGGFISFNTASPATVYKYYYPASGGLLPGGGGAGSPDVASNYGTYGGNGMVILRW